MEYLNQILRRILFLPPQASSIARQVDALHYVVIITTMIGATAIAVIALVYCIVYRQPKTRKHGAARKLAPTPSLFAELTVVGALFALFVTWWGVGFWQYVKIEEPPRDTYDVYVSGKEWMWKFAYPNGSHSIHTLYVPARRPVRLILTSRDVIHSFYLPDFRVKQDAVPGRYTTIWFTAEQPGKHRVFCAEYCGTWHSRMLGEVVALSAADFQDWLRRGEQEQDYPLDPDLPLVSAAGSSLVRRGQEVAAAYGCLRCHSVDGSPHIGPTWAGLYDASVPLAGGGSVVADVAYLTESMMDPRAKIHRGFAAVMPSYISYLKPAEVGALVSYIESLRTLPTVAALAPVPEPSGGTYTIPNTEPTQAPNAAGAIGTAPGQPLGSNELAITPPAPGPTRPIEGVPNPLPREPPSALEGRMLEQNLRDKNGRRP